MNDDAKMAWLAARRNGISGTDVAAICGLSKWTTALKLWAWKTGKLAEDGEETEPMRIGKLLEPWLLARYLERTGRTWPGHVPETCSVLTPAPWLLLASKAQPWMLGSPDVFCGDRGVDFKCSSLFSEWGAEGTDEIPSAALVQCQWYMAVTGLARWDVFAFLGGRTLRLYELTANPELQTALVERCRAWWQRCIVEGAAPEASAGDSPTLSALHPSPSEEMRPANLRASELARRYAEARKEEKKYAGFAEGFAASLKAEIASSRGLIGPDWHATWSPVKASDYMVHKKAGRTFRVTFDHDEGDDE